MFGRWLTCQFLMSFGVKRREIRGEALTSLYCFVWVDRRLQKRVRMGNQTF